MNNNRGFVSWGFIAVMFAISIGLSVYSDWSKQNQLQQRMSTLQAETAENAAQAEKAEKAPPIHLKKGIWKSLDKNGTTSTISFLDANRFAVTISLGDNNENKYSSSGTYIIKGSTIVFNVTDGPKGMFPSNGRMVVKQISANVIQIGGSDYLSPEGVKAQKEEEERNSFINTMAQLDPKILMVLAGAIVVVVGYTALTRWSSC